MGLPDGYLKRPSKNYYIREVLHVNWPWQSGIVTTAHGMPWDIRSGASHVNNIETTGA